MSLCLVKECQEPKEYGFFCYVHADYFFCKDCWDAHCNCCECDESMARRDRELAEFEAMPHCEPTQAPGVRPVMRFLRAILGH